MNNELPDNESSNKSEHESNHQKKRQQDNGSDSNLLDDQWLTLSQDWQSQPYQKTDIQTLLKQTKKRTQQAKLLLALDIITTIGLFITLLVGLYQGDWQSATITYLIFGVITSLVFVYYEIQIRLRSWQHSCDSPDKAVANAIAGIESSIKYIKLIKLSCWLLLPVANFYLYVVLEASEKSPWPIFFAMNTFIFSMWFFAHWFYKKRNTQLSQLNSGQLSSR